MAADDATERDLLLKVITEHDEDTVDRWVGARLDRAATAMGERDLRVEGRAVPEELRGGLAVLALKDALLGAVESETHDLHLRYRAALAVSRLLDATCALTSAVHARGREETIRTQHQQMLDLSTPVVRLWPGVLAVPLIGTMDSARIQLAMDGLLHAVQADEALVTIIDITGVPTVDTLVARHLLQTAAAVRLMGAECFISGIRPAIARTFTKLGIDLSTITTRATLADALAEAVRLLDTDPSASPPLVPQGER